MEKIVVPKMKDLRLIHTLYTWNILMQQTLEFLIFCRATICSRYKSQMHNVWMYLKYLIKVDNIFKVKYRGQSHPIHGINLQEMMPNTLHFMSYEGSVTYPGCWETVTWIVLNKPIYISAQDLFGLRMLMQGDEVNPKAPLARNSR